ncbi:hypothetical protein IMZ29_00845 [Achromobacter sp. GG226]|uniref:hypothetical protein n=1 Tax=Verticiella alkaliphila TaxID=2779529 RepID=UPI001C0B1531|nr:hypothetical protein [Verticiella sp. GG226]MBU4609150.1 hypothetical protein [Verticiella sp. GG226]
MSGRGGRLIPVEMEYAEKTEAKRQFDDLLKTSSYFQDVINTVRTGAGAAVGAVLAEVLRDKPEEALRVLEALRAGDRGRTIRFNEGPSGRGAMELVLRAAADRLQVEMTGKKSED